MLGEIRNQSLQLGVFGFGLLQDGDVEVGVFPEVKEILIGRFCLGGVTLHGVGAAELKMSKSTDRRVPYDSAMVEDFLKLCRCLATLLGDQIGLSSNKSRIQNVP